MRDPALLTAQEDSLSVFRPADQPATGGAQVIRAVGGPSAVVLAAIITLAFEFNLDLFVSVAILLLELPCRIVTRGDYGRES